MRTTEIGAWTPPNGTTPGMRRPVRTITRPPISSRRIRFGEPTSPAPSGGTVAAFRPTPAARPAFARLVHNLVLRPPPRLQREVVARQLDLDSSYVRVEHTQRLVEQLLPGLVPLQTADRPRPHPPPGCSPARRWLPRRLYGQERRMETAWLPAPRVPVRGLARPGDHGRGRAGADRVAQHPAGVEGRLDFIPSGRHAAGHRRRQGGPAAVPLPPRISRTPRAGEIRQARALRGAPPGAPENH